MLLDTLYIGYITLLYHYMPNIYIILLLLMNDNLVVSYNYWCDIYRIKYKLSIYEQSYIDRYIYYISVLVIKLVLHILFYTNEDFMLKYFILLTTTPTIFSHILASFDPILSTLKLASYKIYTYLLYDIIKYVMKVMCLTTIQYDPNLTHEEIDYIVGKNHTDNLLAFVRSFLVLSVIQTISNGNTYSLRFLKTVYNNNVDIKYSDPYPTIRSQRKKMKQIIKQRRWEQFCNPYVVQLMTKMYHERQIDNMQLELFVKALETAFAKLFISITIAKVSLYFFKEINCYVVIGVMSCAINDIQPMDIVIRLGGFLVGYYTDNCYLCAFVCEYSRLLFTVPLQWLKLRTTEVVYKNKHLVGHYNVYNYYLILHIMLCYMPMNMYTFIFSLMVSKHPRITLWFYMGNFSNFSLLHMFLLMLLLYIILNIYYAQAVKPVPIKMLYITNYITKETPLTTPTNIVQKVLPLRNLYLLNSMYNPIHNKIPE